AYLRTTRTSMRRPLKVVARRQWTSDESAKPRRRDCRSALRPSRGNARGAHGLSPLEDRSCRTRRTSRTIVARPTNARGATTRPAPPSASATTTRTTWAATPTIPRASATTSTAPVTETTMPDVTYEVVEHDGGWAYKVGDVISETYPTHR